MQSFICSGRKTFNAILRNQEEGGTKNYIHWAQMDAKNFHESLLLFTMVLVIMGNPYNLKLASYEDEDYRSEQGPTEAGG
jgi:23S rRNA G2445 N2-methylase RlmL